jgi:TolB-like protein
MNKMVISEIIMVLFFTLGFAEVPSPKTITILVLPFQNSSDPAHSWVAAGMGATVISDLNRISGVSVVSDQERQNAMKELSLSMTGLLEENKALQVGKMLAADAILSGNVLVIGENIRVNTTLVNVKTGTLINAVKLDGTLPAIFQLQDKIVFNLLNDTRKIVSASGIIGEMKQEKNRPSLSAFEWFSKGQDLFYNKKKSIEAIECLKKAIEIDSTYIDALSLLGWISSWTAWVDYYNALAPLEKALDICFYRNDTGTIQYARLLQDIGFIKSLYDRTLREALDAYLKSISIRESLNLQNTKQYLNLLKYTGDLYLEKGDSSIGLEYRLKSKRFYESFGLHNTINYLNLLLDIGIIYWNKKSLNQALDYFLKSNEVYKSLGIADTIDFYHADRLNDKFGEMRWTFGDKFGAILERATLALNEKVPRGPYDFQNTYGYAMLMECIGFIYNSKGASEQALTYYLKSKSIRESSGFQNTYGYGELLYSIGILYEKEKNRKLASQYFHNTLDTFAKANYNGPLLKKTQQNIERLSQ